MELPPLVVGKGGEQIALVFAGNLPQGTEHFSAVGGQVQGMAATVVLIAAALHKTTAVQRIEQGYEPAGNDLQTRGERLLRDAGFATEHAQDSGMGRSEPDGEQALSKTRSGMAADLRQQERGIAPGFRRCVAPAGLFHKIIVPQQNRSCK
ncbi:MAG TPA: hypothetical protein VJV22_07135 [Acidobacteriaceae bacterium]|nr:hypothetical protein [Acidobacteriaceae bacterium]